jgi:hypothetical protein
MATTKPTAFVLPHDPLTPWDAANTPTSAMVRLLCREIYANAQSVDSTLGGGEHGHLGALMPGDEYMVIADGEEYISPDKPEVPTLTGNQVNRETQQRDYILEQAAFQEQRQLMKQLKKLLMDAIPAFYIKSLSHSTMGFGMVDPGQILSYLIDKFGTITAQDLKANMAQLKAPWNPDTQIEILFAIGDDCRQFAADGKDPISDLVYTGILVDQFLDSGVLTEAVREWELMEPSAQTLPLCVKHFTKANKYRVTSKAYLKDILAANPVIATTELPPTRPPRGPPNQYPASASMADWYYCWTHGVCSHPGTHCRYPGEGHVQTATARDRHNGSTSLRVGPTERFDTRNPTQRSKKRRPDGR